MPYPRSALALWRRQRRVASPEVLSTYLIRQLPDGTLPGAMVDAVVAAMPDQGALESLLSGLSPSDLDDLLDRLTGYSVGEIPAEGVQPACTVLLGLYPRLRTGPKSVLDVGPESALDRVVVHVLGREASAGRRAVIVEALCADVQGLTGKVRLLHAAGRGTAPPAGRLIPVGDSDLLFRNVCREVRHASAAQLTAEPNLLWLLATALEEDPADREDLDKALTDDGLARALLLSARIEVHEWSTGGSPARASHQLRWQLLGTVAGDDASITHLVNRVAARIRDDDEAAAVDLARRYLAGWRPPGSASPSQAPVVRQPSAVPTMHFSPTAWPALLIRSAATYEIDPAWAAQGDLSGAEFHRRLADTLASLPLARQVAALAEARGLPGDISAWKPDTDASQLDRTAVQSLTIGPADEPTATLRYAVILNDSYQGGPVKLIADIAVSPKQETDDRWGLLSLEEARNLLAGAAESTAGPMAVELLRSIFKGEEPPRATVELYLWPSQGTTGNRPSSTLDTRISLEPLGPPARTDRPPQQGMFAAAGATPTATASERLSLVVHALIRMALDWGYLDARAHLTPWLPDGRT
jgi:hypothetical protein